MKTVDSTYIRERVTTTVILDVAPSGLAGTSRTLTEFEKERIPVRRRGHRGSHPEGGTTLHLHDTALAPRPLCMSSLVSCP